MNITQIKKFCRYLGISVFSEKTKGWAKIPCPLAPYTHESGKDSNPSFGIKIKNGRPSNAHCFSGETRVVTYRGIFPISELAGGYHKVLTEGGVWRTSYFKEYGRQRLFKIRMSLNGVLRTEYATSDHRWFVRGNSNPVLTKNLLKNHRLEAVLPSNSVPPPNEEGIRHGIVYGDGSKSGKCYRVVLHGIKNKLKVYFKDYTISKVNYDCCNLDECHSVHIKDVYYNMKELPSLNSDPSYLSGFIAGWVATDGCVTKTGIQLHNKDEKTLEWLRLVCLRIGMATHPTKKWTRKGYGGVSDIHGISFVLSTFPEFMMLRKERPYPITKFNRLRWMVISVEETNRVETVYCAEVPSTHSFSLENNLLTGNCFTCGFAGDLGELIIELKYRVGHGNGMDLVSARKMAEADEEGGGMEIAYAEEDELEKEEEFIYHFPESWLETFPLAINSDEALSYCQSRGVPERVVEELELRYDPRENRICFPIRDDLGDLIGLHGRGLTEDVIPKYRMYTYPIKDGHNNPQFWYGEDTIDWDKPVVVVESVFDYLSIYRYYKNVICPLTAEINIGKIKRIQDALFIILILDSDKAGRKAAYKIKRQLKHIPVSDIRLPQGQDPGDLNTNEVKEILDPHLINLLTNENFCMNIKG